MRRFTILSMIAALALITVSAARADDTPTPGATKTEKHNPVQHILSKFDKNNDGFLEMDELTALVAAHQKHESEAGKSTEKGTEVDPSARAAKLMKKFDANGDGKLDATEIQAMVRELHARREAHKKVVTPSAST